MVKCSGTIDQSAIESFQFFYCQPNVVKWHLEHKNDPTWVCM